MSHAVKRVNLAGRDLTDYLAKLLRGLKYCNGQQVDLHTSSGAIRLMILLLSVWTNYCALLSIRALLPKAFLSSVCIYHLHKSLITQNQLYKITRVPCKVHSYKTTRGL